MNIVFEYLDVCLSVEIPIEVRKLIMSHGELKHLLSKVLSLKIELRDLNREREIVMQEELNRLGIGVQVDDRMEGGFSKMLNCNLVHKACTCIK